jgi:hypothetical protein
MSRSGQIGMSLVDSELKNESKGTGYTPKQFTKRYIESPKYKERLKSSGYSVEEEIKKRLSNVEGTRRYNQYGKPSPSRERKLNLESTPYTHGGSSFLPRKSAVVVDLKQAEDYKMSPESIAAHEFGHSETGVGSVKYDKDTGIRESRLNTSDNKQIISRLKKDANKVYKKAPDEVKSDLNSLRYELQKEGLYDAGTEDFDKSILEELEDSYIKTRLLKNFTEDDLEWMMNNIAMNVNNIDNTNNRPKTGLESINYG